MNSTIPFLYPTIYNFPPFFTRQVNSDTWKKQLQLWSDLILSYFRHHKKYQMNVREALMSEPFKNASIGRSLKAPVLVEILDHLAAEGNVEWLMTAGSKGGGSSENKEFCLVMWRSPSEWAKVMCINV